MVYLVEYNPQSNRHRTIYMNIPNFQEIIENTYISSESQGQYSFEFNEINPKEKCRIDRENFIKVTVKNSQSAIPRFETTIRVYVYSYLLKEN